MQVNHLPLTTLQDVLCTWLDSKSMTIFDSAACSKPIRKILSSRILKSSGFVLHGCNNDSFGYYHYLTAHKLLVSSLVLNDTGIYALSYFNKKLPEVLVSLEIFLFGKLLVPSSQSNQYLIQFLKHCTSLRKLKLRNVECGQIELSCWEKLEILIIANSPMPDLLKFLNTLANSNACVKELSLLYFNREEKDVLKNDVFPHILKQQQHLQRLKITGFEKNITKETISNITSQCTSLIHVDLEVHNLPVHVGLKMLVESKLLLETFRYVDYHCRVYYNQNMRFFFMECIVHTNSYSGMYSSPRAKTNPFSSHEFLESMNFFLHRYQALIEVIEISKFKDMPGRIVNWIAYYCVNLTSLQIVMSKRILPELVKLLENHKKCTKLSIMHNASEIFKGISQQQLIDLLSSAKYLTCIGFDYCFRNATMQIIAGVLAVNKNINRVEFLEGDCYETQLLQQVSSAFPNMVHLNVPRLMSKYHHPAGCQSDGFGDEE